MAARVYATEADYLEYPGTGDLAPENVDQLLRVASKVVDRLLRTRVYATDADGLPTDPDHTEALTEATCAIAAAMDAEGTLAPAATVGGDWSSIKVGSLSLTAGATDTTGGATAGEVDGIPVPPAAVLALSDVGHRSILVTG